ncbi:hypothetical protein NDU88_004570 [Pleurodeles waltl]|uniref:Uncharacterized protein n=1 Tax=Pleurodeles waltl TaxID=8319 RepID=A0AAV7W9B2_PLEWA|nr:hypothetical protein NDU88_004570 [Pleurodeles waltl]
MDATPIAVPVTWLVTCGESEKLPPMAVQFFLPCVSRLLQCVHSLPQLDDFAFQFFDLRSYFLLQGSKVHPQGSE